VQSFREISIGLLLAGGESARRNGGGESRESGAEMARWR